MRKPLSEFATNIRLSDAECKDVTEVVKRYLGVHLKDPAVYSTMIGNDYSLMELNAHNPPLKAYSRVDSSVFLAAVKKLPDDLEKYDFTPKEMHTFERFRGEVFVRPIDEEIGTFQSRRGQWKEKAAFLALQYGNGNKKNLLDTLELEYDIRRRLMDVEVSLDTKMAGKMIAAVQEMEDDVLIEASPQGLREASTETKVSAKPLAGASAPAVPTPPISLQPIPDSIIESYRKRAGIPVMVDNKKVLGQMFASALGLTIENCPKEILTKHQSSIEAVTPEEREILNAKRGELNSIESIIKAI